MGREGKRDELKGRVKKAAGEVTGDRELKREGSIDKATGKAKQFVDDVGEALRGDDDGERRRTEHPDR